MRKLFCSILLLLFSLNVQSQSILQRQSFLNFNPAYAGSENNFSITPFQYKIRIKHPEDRYDEEYFRYAANVELNFDTLNSGFAFLTRYVNSKNVYSAWSKSRHAFYLNTFIYNYELMFNKNVKLRLGTSISYWKNFSQFSYIGIPTHTVESRNYNIDFGAWFTAKSFYAGISGIDIFTSYRTDYKWSLIAGREFKIKNFYVDPSFTFYGYPFFPYSAVSWNINFSYKHFIYVGIAAAKEGYLGGDFSYILGCEIKKRIQVFTAYNIYNATNPVPGAIELMVKYKIGKDKKWF